MGEVSQLLVACAGFLDRAIEHDQGGGLVLVLGSLACDPQVVCEGQQPLLSSVMQVTLESPALRIAGRDDLRT